MTASGTPSDNGGMEWLNYHHLFYFSVIAEEGGVAPAARKLRVTHSTLSAQLRALEEHLGAPLFERRGKRLVLTAFGRDAASYARDIFRLGRELVDVASGRATAGREVLRVGALPGLPKTLVHHLLAPALDHPDAGATFVCQDEAPRLLESLATGRLHLVLTNDVPATPPGIQVHVHALGDTDILLYARAKLARSLRRGFPRSLEQAPFVLPPAGTALRRRLDAWFADHGVRILVKAELDDAGMLRAFGGAGRGVFPVRAALRAEVEDLHDLQRVGRCAGVRERYYAVTLDRKLRHPALVALVDRARTDLYMPRPSRRGGSG